MRFKAGWVTEEEYRALVEQGRQGRVEDDRLRQEGQAKHDRTGEHVWVEVATFSDDRHHFMCAYCSTELWTAFDCGRIQERAK